MKKQNWVCGKCGAGPHQHAINIPTIINRNGRRIGQHAFRPRLETGD